MTHLPGSDVHAEDCQNQTYHSFPARRRTNEINPDMKHEGGAIPDLV